MAKHRWDLTGLTYHTCLKCGATRWKDKQGFYYNRKNSTVNLGLFPCETVVVEKNKKDQIITNGSQGSL